LFSGAMSTSVLSTAIAVACASPPAAPTRAEAVSIAVDAALLDEVVPLAAALIRSRPENPPGHEHRAIAVLAERLTEPRLRAEIAPFETATSGGDARTNLRVDLPGTDPRRAPLVLLAHADVVPADPAAWSVSPWDGVVRGGALYGRGAADMLGPTALQALTLVALARQPLPLPRTIVLLVTGDEEGEGKGIQAALERWPDLKEAFAVLTEGSFLLESYLRPGEDLAPIAVAEKGLFQFRLEAQGASGHGSTPMDGAAADRVVLAAERVLRREPPFVLTRPVADNLAALGAGRGGVEGMVLGTPWLRDIVARRTMGATSTTRALVNDTCALTVLRAGDKTNVIPGRAEAVFDCRLLPDTSPAVFRDALLVAVDDPRVSLVPLQVHPATGSDPDHPLVEALRARLEREAPAPIVTTTLTKGATDCRFLRDAGVPCFGFSPIRLNAEELDAIHGDDERVRTDELEKGLSRLVDVVMALAKRSDA
jgi:acetylornithine deacetylase/succinyl-diaminopimelate desuccinylase-like protein